MTGEARPLAYRAEFRAEGLVYGTGREAPWLLGLFQTLSPKLALRWLQSEALRIACRLDPDPAHSPWAPPGTLGETVPVSDAPAELRVWATDPQERRAAWERVRADEPFSIAVPDVDCVYGLCVWPLWHSAELVRPDLRRGGSGWVRPSQSHTPVPVPRGGVMRANAGRVVAVVALVGLAGCTTSGPPLSTVEAAEKAHPCLTGSAYSPVTGAMVTVEPWTVTVYPGPDDRRLILTRSTDTGRWEAADAVSRQILAELGCT